MRAVSALCSAAIAALLLVSCGQTLPAAPERQPTQLTAPSRKGDVPIVRGSGGALSTETTGTTNQTEPTTTTSAVPTSSVAKEPTPPLALPISETPSGSEPNIQEVTPNGSTGGVVKAALDDPSIARTPEEASIQAAAHPELLAEEQFSVSNTSCGSSLELPSLTEDALVLAVSDTFEDVYVEKGTARLDAIWWSDESYAEWSYIYKAAGDAADLLPVQAMPEIDLSHPWRWINVRRGQYLVYGRMPPNSSTRDRRTSTDCAGYQRDKIRPKSHPTVGWATRDRVWSGSQVPMARQSVEAGLALLVLGGWGSPRR